ncbi:MAG TPA: lipopolysaccharide heptosyltransferase I, partial [Myxococcota bacterium]|nr:lipopolysaccharide heptosyltransferase I [Myxococcota bacterium]
ERPGVELHWAVEEAYVPLVRLHPGVSHIVPVALRRWRRRLLERRTWQEIRSLRASLAAQPFDAILDTQGLLKSVLVAKMARGPVHGFGPRTAREPIASRFYDFRYEFSPADHKVERYREVAARALGYARDCEPDYGIEAPPRPAFAPSAEYCVLLHATAREAKLWSEQAWRELGRWLESRGLACVLPWGSGPEHARSLRIAEGLAQALVPPRMSIDEAAGLIGHAKAAIGVDTGLMHLAAALRVPVVGVFCDSEPLDAKPVGRGPTAFRGGIGKPPRAAEVMEALGEVAPEFAP